MTDNLPRPEPHRPDRDGIPPTGEDSRVGPDHTAPPSTAGSDQEQAASLWRGRIMLIAGIALLGISLRYAITGMSPFLPQIQEDLGMGAAGATLLGMLPTLFFGAAGFLTPVLIRRTSLELAAVSAMLLAALGTGLRATVDSVPLFLVLSALALFGMGMGNVVGAPLVKKYFPDRPAPMLTLFALLMQAGATIPSMLALPLADVGNGWRFSIGSWALLSLVAAIPWIIQLVKVTREEQARANADGQESPPPARSFGLGYLITNPISIGTALFYAMASLNTYAMLAWMPTIFQSLGHDEGSAATAFAIFTFLTLPLAAISPIVGSKLRNPFPYAAALTILPAVGFLGLFFWPGAHLLWASLIGLIGGGFPLAITMFNQRTRTQEGSGAISGFAMGVGYLAGTLGPLLGGWLNAATGGWSPSLLVYAFVGVPMLFAAWLMCKPGRYLEDRAAKPRTSP